MVKSVSVQRGYIPLLVGEVTEPEKVLVHRKVLQHPYFSGLLELAAMEFGHEQKGVLRIPCDMECFRRVVQVIRRKMWRKKVAILCFPLPRLIVTIRE